MYVYTHLLAGLQVVVHSLNGLEDNVVPEQIIERAKDPHLSAERFRLCPLHPTMTRNSREGDTTSGVQLEHAANQLLTFCTREYTVLHHKYLINQH